MDLNLILAIGGAEDAIGFFEVIWPILSKSYYLIAIAVIVGVTSFIVMHKSQKIYQHSLSKRVKKIKDCVNAYKNEENLVKKEEIAKSHAKNIKKLDRKIKSILAFNSKKIYIPKELLEDKENLSIDPNNPFTFKDRLDALNVGNKKKNKAEIIEVVEGRKVTNNEEELTDTNNVQQNNALEDNTQQQVVTPTQVSLTEEKPTLQQNSASYVFRHNNPNEENLNGPEPTL